MPKSSEIEGLSPKLTKPQRDLLESAERAEYGVTVAEHYPPVKRLLALGLISENRGRWSTTFVITDAGRAALSAKGRAMSTEDKIAELRPAPRRAFVLDLKVEADTLKDLIGYLRNFEIALHEGRVSTGVSGGYGSGSTYSLSVDETITHDSWAAATVEYVRALFARQRP